MKKFNQIFTYLCKNKLRTTTISIITLCLTMSCFISVFYCYRLYSSSIKSPIILANVTTTQENSEGSDNDPEQDDSNEGANALDFDCTPVQIKSGDSLVNIFKRLNLEHKDVHATVNAGDHGKQLANILPGHKMCVQIHEGELQGLAYDVDRKNTIHIRRDEDDNFISYLEEHQIEKRIVFKHATINNYLFLDAQRAGFTPNMIMNTVKIFSWDIDFALDIQPGDEVYVLFEEEYKDGERISNAEIIAAEFINAGRSYKAIRYTDNDNNVFFYTPEGNNLRKAFIRTPVKFTRISSHFNLKRMHPILHRIRAHKGVDYAAPKGTPIKASGNGKIAFMGVKGGYGNAIIIQHGHKYSTLYGHLSKFSKNIRVGSKIKQDQVIGYVGMTGLASAPHLHYEFRVYGVHKNPLTVQLPTAYPIDANRKTDFLEHSREILEILENHKKEVKENK